MASPIWRFFLSVLVAGAVFWLGLYLVDLGELGQVLLAADYWYLVPAAMLYFVSLWFRVMRWRVVLVGVPPEVALAHALTVHLLVSGLPVNVAGVGVVLVWTIRRRRAYLDVRR